MVKLKHRYFLIEVIFEDNFSQATQYDIIKEIKDKVLEMYGDYGLGTLNSTFGVSVAEVGKGLIVIKVGVESVNFLRGSIPFIVKAGKASCILKILLEAASMRSINKKMVRINLDQLYDKLSNSKSIKEKIEIQEGIIKVTGTNSERVRF
ncbi:Ribonuclease P/MRP protein subunit family-containing protein [Strongyloides ratti]|uniref:Ribonuclease P/MRP protein subunit POP5 n=1 Tax=Strongyloides ratti TaxID=34506 RepID=A0A090L6R6_STRRB|nr:Ribonuclease P/MRP protein subunit family-containing protein [Strongyloides ratti]CEF65437.1 Ribonuclease P/MRP protein subunit family-containing protein [Strongyloides ratti]